MVSCRSVKEGRGSIIISLETGSVVNKNCNDMNLRKDNYLPFLQKSFVEYLAFSLVSVQVRSVCVAVSFRSENKKEDIIIILEMNSVVKKSNDMKHRRQNVLPSLQKSFVAVNSSTDPSASVSSVFV